MTTMKAMAVHEFGPAENLIATELDIRQPGPGELLIRVKAAAVNPADLGMRQGGYPWQEPVRMPMVPGYDIAGIVETGTARFPAGTAVIGYTAHTATQIGGYAEFVTLPERLVAVAPGAGGSGARPAAAERNAGGAEGGGAATSVGGAGFGAGAGAGAGSGAGVGAEGGRVGAAGVGAGAGSGAGAESRAGLGAGAAGLESVDWAVAAALPLAGLTAQTALRTLNLSPGDRLLVNRVDSAVGRLVAQLAGAAGIEVLSVTGKAADPADFGPYLTLTDSLSAIGTVDAALDVVGADTALATFARVRDHGRYATIIPEFWVPGGQFTPARGIDPTTVFVDETVGDLSELARLTESGAILPAVAETFPLSAAAEAHRRLEAGGGRGKLILVP